MYLQYLQGKVSKCGIRVPIPIPTEVQERTH